MGLSHTGIVLLPRMSKDRISLFCIFDNFLFYLIHLIVDSIVNLFGYGCKFVELRS